MLDSIYAPRVCLKASRIPPAKTQKCSGEIFIPLDINFIDISLRLSGESVYIFCFLKLKINQ